MKLALPLFRQQPKMGSSAFGLERASGTGTAAWVSFTIAWLCWVHLSATAVAQGTVKFINSSTTLVSNGTSLISGPVGSYYFALLTAPVGASDLRQFTFSGVYATNQATAGRLYGGSTVTVPGWPAGTARSFLVWGWDAAYYGPTWNPIWLELRFSGMGGSVIATGVAGGIDPNTGENLPALSIFSSSTISAGFNLFGCLGGPPQPGSIDPASQAVVLGGSASIYALIPGCPPPTLQWYHDGVPLPGGVLTNYGNESILTITNAQRSDAGYYGVVGRNEYGEAATPSSLLTVLAEPVITAQPQSQSSFAGSTAALHVNAIGTPPLAYQWFFGGTPVPDASTSNLVLTNPQLSQAGVYTVLITNVYGAITSAPATVAVIASPPVLSRWPRDQRAMPGGLAEFTVKAEGALPLSYQWFFNGESLANATNSSLRLTGLQTAQSGAYSVVVTNALGKAVSAPAQLRIEPRANWPAGTVVAWGNAAPVPADATNVVAISAGAEHDLALRADGTVLAWGQDNTFGETTVPAGLANVVAIAAGYDHNLALKADGTVVAWGWNYQGQTDVPPGLSNVTAVAASGMRSMALKSDGIVAAWGAGSNSLPADLDGVIAIAAGINHSLALRYDGRVMAGGDYYYGQTYVPVDLSGVTWIAAGGAHSLGVTMDGRCVGWGGNYDAQSWVPPRMNGVIAASIGSDLFNLRDDHGVALRFDGTVAGWGNNERGQASVPTGLGHVIAVSAGAYHTLALVAGGSAASPTVMPLSSITAEAGSRVRFYARAAGAPPLAFQWLFNTVPVADGTNEVLDLGAVMPAQAGSYSVIVANVFGAVTSAPARLNVIADVPRRLAPALQLTGLLTNPVNLEVTAVPDSMSGWAPLASVNLMESPQWYFDSSMPLPPKRFYRGWQADAPVGLPLLELEMVPAIALTGAPGNYIRLDYINQFGPVDAWRTLATVLLTNSSQLYFDTSAVGQPPRLYRLIR